MQDVAEAPAAAQADFLPLEGIDHVHFFVGNAKQAAYYYRAAFGMTLTAYSGPETGSKQMVSYLLEQGRIRLVLSTPLGPNHPAAAQIKAHGDGVRGIAFTVGNAGRAHAEAVRRGARSCLPPSLLQDDCGEVRLAAIHTYGDTIHTFVERRNYRGCFLPSFTPVADADSVARPVGLLRIDHIVGNVALGEMSCWVKWYHDVLGFHIYQSFDDKDISTEYSALMSKVMSNGNGRVKFPINEPAEGKRKSQIEEFLDFYRGPGVQHIALETGDIVESVSKLKAQGVEFLEVPQSYYDELPGRVGEIAESMEQVARLGILVDRDEEGYLLQIFTRPVEDRPTLFYEIIQRKGSRSFGKGNFKALFEAIEREQARRGNL